MPYRFDDVVVDVALGEVRVDGERRPVEPQVFDVLVHLIEQRHRVVHKEELLDEVWGSRFVSGSAITSRIKSARQAIGDTGRDQRLIRTVHGRGYRFVGEVDEGDAGASAEPAHAARPDPATAADPSVPARSARPPIADASGAPDGSRDIDWPLLGRDAELAEIVSLVHQDGTGGVLLTGAAGVGKSRLARAALEMLSDSGRSVARINGHTEISTVPLGAVAHLLPAELVDITGLPGDLARAALLQRAREAIGRIAHEGQLILMVDDVERIDRLSSALLASLIESGSVFALMTQRLDGGETPAMDDLVRSGRIAHRQLDVLAADQLTALLGRVLGGALEPETSAALVRAASGSPGLLRQLVDSSIDSGALTRRNDIWVIRGDVSTPPDLAAAIDTRLAGLSDVERDALELIAIAGDLDLDIAFSLIDDEVLDGLELAGYVAVRTVGPSARIRVSHPLFGEILRDRLPPLRSRRHRMRLADAIAASDTSVPADVLRLVQLRMDTDGEIDDELLLRSVALAIVEGDYLLGLRLSRRIRGAAFRSRAMHLRGEALYMIGRFDEAADVLRSIDLDELDEAAAADVVRRLATYRFFGKWQHGQGIEELRAATGRFQGDALAMTESYLAGIIAFDGRDAEGALELTARLVSTADGVALAEAHCAAALAHLTRGELQLALQELADFRRVNSGIDRALTDSGSRWSCMTEMLVHLQGGDPAAARAAHDRDFGPGMPPNIRFVAMAAGRVALAGGDYQLVFDWLDPLIEIADSIDIATLSAPLRAATALAALTTGDHERARSDVALVREALPDEPTLARFDLLWSIHQVEGALDDRDAAIAALLEAADDAATVGNRYCEEQLVSAATYLGGASSTEPLLRVLAAEVDGPLVAIRHRAALAAGSASARDEVARELVALGMVHEAAQVRQMPG